jgi:hypothetical protein
MPFGRFDRSKESILLVVIYHDAHPLLLARLVLRSIVRAFPLQSYESARHPGYPRLMVLQHQPNGMDRIQRSTFCCSLLGIPDSASVGGLGANQTKVKAISNICFRLPSGGFGALLMPSNHWPTTRCSSSIAMLLSQEEELFEWRFHHPSGCG